jgi:dTDP-glucose 4,6-dehydratase
MKRQFKNVIVTGGAGFIGSHLVKKINEKMPDARIFIIDSLTYAGNLDNIAGTDSRLFCIDIRNDEHLNNMKALNVDVIFHLAAESHVDRSIENPMEFVETNIIGTVNLLELGLHYKSKNPDFLFYHVSTDEVFGSLNMEDSSFHEETPYDPRSPYSASKAASDHFVRAYNHTYGLPIIISNCSNNYGPNQYPEKLIPVVINSLKERKPIPVYGQGINVRDWLYVEDHADAIIEIAQGGKIGETYCIGGNCELTNLELIQLIINQYDEINETDSNDLIQFVNDRPGHDLRYSINFDKLNKDLNWEPKTKIEDGLKETILWYSEIEYID